MGKVSIQVVIRDDTVVVKRFQQFVPPADGAEGLRKVCREAEGWLQLFRSSVSDEQWENEVRTAQSRGVA